MKQDPSTEYAKLRGLYEQYGHVLVTLIRSLLDSHDISYVAIEHRTKTIDSFVEKANRPGKGYVSPLSEITDLTGVRIITYDQSSSNSVCDIIKSEFDVDEINSVDKSLELKENEVGYLSVHFVISISSQRGALAEYKAYGNFKAEIQVRTVLQHAWSAIDHRLRYKRSTDIPKQLQRRLFRLAGLLEVADDEFSRIISEGDTLRFESQTRPESGMGELLLSTASLSTFLERSRLAEQLSEELQKAGVFMAAETNADEISESVAILKGLGYVSIGGVIHVLENTLPHATNYFRHLKASAYKGYEMGVSAAIGVEQLAILQHYDEIDVGLLLKGGYQDPFAEKLRSAVVQFAEQLRKQNTSAG